MSSRTKSACYPQRTFYSLSDGPSIQNHRITMTDFRLCSVCQPCSQAGLCHYTLRTGFRPVRAYYCAPPLLFGRRPPQSNYPPYIVLARDSTDIVRFQKRTGWYFTFDSTRTGVLASTSPTYATQSVSKINVKL